MDCNSWEEKSATAKKSFILISCNDCQLVKKVYHDRNDRIFIADVHRQASFAKEIISKYD
jgi:hypothetical protein